VNNVSKSLIILCKFNIYIYIIYVSFMYLPVTYMLYMLRFIVKQRYHFIYHLYIIYISFIYLPVTYMLYMLRFIVKQRYHLCTYILINGSQLHSNFDQLFITFREPIAKQGYVVPLLYWYILIYIDIYWYIYIIYVSCMYHVCIISTSFMYHLWWLMYSHFYKLQKPKNNKITM
jgi:hypothetical protein